MKNIKKIFLAAALCFLLAAPVCVVQADDAGEVTPVPTETPAPEPSVIPTPTPVPLVEGWNKLPNGKKMFVREGKPVKGLQSIKKNTYCFDADGYLLVNDWFKKGNKTYHTDKNGIIIKNRLATIQKKVYYFNSKGYLHKGWKTFKNGKSYFGTNGARVTGLKKIGKKYYYFNSKGIMKTGTVKVKTNTYYLNAKGELEARQKGSKYYYPGGKPMSSVDANDFATLQAAKGIVNKITSKNMSKAQKLQTCFNWVIKKPYVNRRSFVNVKGWPAVYANDHFKLGGGNCFADGAAFAYLAKALGYTNVYVCVDSKGPARGHAWAEVNGLVYDPLFAEAKSYSRNYGVRYGVYPLHPILHIKV